MNVAQIGLTLCIHPSDLRRVERFSLPLCHLAYRISRDFTLLRNGTVLTARGGLMGLGDYELTGEENYRSGFAQSLIDECRARDYSGIYLDFEKQASAATLKFVYEAGDMLSKSGLEFIIPAALYEAAPKAALQVNAFVPDGSCYEAYRRAVFRWGADRMVLVYEPFAEDIPMNGATGIRLNREALRRSIADHNAVISFSREYAAAYFTYAAPDCKHFVIFDDERSFLLKAAAARSAGIRRLFAAYPNISRDIDTFERGSY